MNLKQIFKCSKEEKQSILSEARWRGGMSGAWCENKIFLANSLHIMDADKKAMLLAS